MQTSLQGLLLLLVAQLVCQQVGVEAFSNRPLLLLIVEFVGKEVGLQAVL